MAVYMAAYLAAYMAICMAVPMAVSVAASMAVYMAACMAACMAVGGWHKMGGTLERDLKFICFGSLIFDDFFEPLQILLLIDVGSVLAPILALFSTCFGEQLRSSKLSSRAAGAQF